MQTVNDIRKGFLDYFATNGHEIVPSSPLVPLNDPTLMFTNAGMVQFKNVFTGLESRDYTTAVTSQKCVRAGGKHNDLENVGRTVRHHTFFEMLGNFSFGDYFKENAIELAWNLITKEYGISQEKLLVTVFSEDDEAFDLWKKIAGLPESRIIRIPTSDNFWSMGDTGPCGPCSEIFYDYGDHIPGGPPGSADEDGDRFIEIWNLVFMQYEQLTLEERVDLPHPSIDTGMGLERLSALMQGTNDNFQTDMFKALIEASADASDTASDGEFAISHRVISDHLRASSFLIADGVLPSNEGRGYVLRRIMRRAMRHAQLMGCKDPLMHRLVPALITQMGQAFGELTKLEPLITETLLLEETRFKTTLDRGLKLLDAETSTLKEGDSLNGDTAFKLHDTYGFPLDLTQDALKSRSISVDIEGFNTAMERQRADARKAWAGSGDAATEAVWFDILQEQGATEFLGYSTESAEGQITALVKDGVCVDCVNDGDSVSVVLSQTPFYGESGGQMGDTGIITIGDVRITISDTAKKLGELHVHHGKVSGGLVKVGEDALLEVDHTRRSGLRANHSVTHLVHEALRRRLGDHVTQKGSQVGPDRMRFDVSHPKPITPEEVKSVEDDVNQQIRINSEIVTRLMDPEAAVEAGAMALFGEKYGEEVRVVSMGSSGASGEEIFSTELCGGTHAHRTGDIAICKIVSESAVSSGVRRLEVVTGQGAVAYFKEQEDTLFGAATVLKSSPADVASRVTQLLDDRKRLERELSDARRALATGGSAGGSDDEIKQINGYGFLGKVVDGIPARELKSLADDLKKKVGSGIVALIALDGGKASLVVGVTEDLSDKINAVDLVRIGAGVVGGKGGGGRPDMAQAGGPDGDKANEAITAIEETLKGS